MRLALSVLVLSRISLHLLFFPVIHRMRPISLNMPLLASMPDVQMIRLPSTPVFSGRRVVPAAIHLGRRATAAKRFVERRWTHLRDGLHGGMVLGREPALVLGILCVMSLGGVRDAILLALGDVAVWTAAVALGMAGGGGHDVSFANWGGQSECVARRKGKKIEGQMRGMGEAMYCLRCGMSA